MMPKLSILRERIKALPLILAASVFAVSPSPEPIVYGYGEGFYTQLSASGVLRTSRL